MKSGGSDWVFQDGIVVGVEGFVDSWFWGL